jgi:hypothetical protein
MTARPGGTSDGSAASLGQPGVQPGLLGGQHVPEDRLADEGVPERVAVGLGHEHVHRHRRPHRGEQRAVADAGDRGEQRVPAPLPGHAQGLQHLLGLGGKTADVGEHQVAQRFRQPGIEVVAVQQRFQEQRVALAAAVHAVGQPGIGLAAQQAGGELARLAARQPGQLQPRHPAEPLEFREHRPQRVAPVQLVGAKGDQDQHAVQDLLVADQEGQQVARGPVGPVRVLDHEDEGPALGQAPQQDQHLLEHPGPRLTRVGLGGRLPELGQQPGQVLGAPAGQQARDAAGAQVADELPQHPGERRERQAFRAQLQAVAGQGPGRVSPGGELADQPRLAYPGLTADEHRRRLAADDPLEGGRERGQFRHPPHQHRGALALAHGLHHVFAPDRAPARRRGDRRR